MATRRPERWCLVVPVKRLAAAKTRLSGPPAREHRGELALAFAVDTVTAALGCTGVGTLVVTDDPVAAQELRALGARVVADAPDAGLNPALAHGIAVAAAAYPGAGVGALSADLPALRSDELALALSRAPTKGAAFVRDVHGDGTTLLVAVRAGDLRPEFGADSATAHQRSGALELVGTDLSSLRQDVDTVADLDTALRMGVGARTAEVARRLAATPAAAG